MTRAHQWRRFVKESTSGLQDDSDVICALTPGETVLRVRGQVNLSVFYSAQDITLGLPIAWGVFIGTSSSAAALDPLTYADMQSQDWMWWEGISLEDSPQFTATSPQYLAYGPRGGPVRDIKAERKADPDDDSYLWVRGNVNSDLTVGYFAWQWSWSALILEAP